MQMVILVCIEVYFFFLIQLLFSWTQNSVTDFGEVVSIKKH